MQERIHSQIPRFPKSLALRLKVFFQALCLTFGKVNSPPQSKQTRYVRLLMVKMRLR